MIEIEVRLAIAAFWQAVFDVAKVLDAFPSGAEVARAMLGALTVAGKLAKKMALRWNTALFGRVCNVFAALLPCTSLVRLARRWSTLLQRP